MKLAILSDIHANREALEACLAHALRQGADAYAFLGDFVGYGADPHACLDLIRSRAEAGAIVLRGNHDDAALGGTWPNMNPVSREAALWTRSRLSGDERAFLASLPYTVEWQDLLFVHASADRPREWEYIDGTSSAGCCLAATGARIVFAGHVHRPMLYFRARESVFPFLPTMGVAMPLIAGRRWLVQVGSVGQPRDGNPAASYAIYDGVSRRLSFHRVRYDWLTTAAKIRTAGLPETLAERLALGL